MAKKQEPKLTLLNLNRGFVKLDLFPEGCHYRYGLAPLYPTDNDSSEYVPFALWQGYGKYYFANILRLSGIYFSDVSARVPLMLFDIDSKQHKETAEFHQKLITHKENVLAELSKLRDESEALAKHLMNLK